MKPLAIAAALLGLLGVVLGAFGAHGLRELVSPERLDVWRTAVSYQMYHVPLLLLLAWTSPGLSRGLLAGAAVCMVAGILVFSGSLYLLVLLDAPLLGMITPVGGTLLIAGWSLLLVAVIRRDPQDPK